MQMLLKQPRGEKLIFIDSSIILHLIITYFNEVGQNTIDIPKLSEDMNLYQ